MKQIDLKKWSVWQIDAAGVALCVALTLGLYLLGIDPLIRRRKDSGAKEAELQTQHEKMERLTQTRMAIREQVADVEVSAVRCRLELLPAGQMNRRIAEVSDLAAQAGLKIDDIQPGSARGGTRYEMVPITLAGKGTYVTCVDFLHRLRKALPDTGVSSLELSGDPAAAGGKATFRFDLLWYAAPRPAS